MVSERDVVPLRGLLFLGRDSTQLSGRISARRRLRLKYSFIRRLGFETAKILDFGVTRFRSAGSVQ